MRMHYTQPKTELGPDLEWMLASHQVSSSLLLETLIHEYYSHIYRLAFSILDDQQAAKQAVLETFSVALLNVHHYRAVTGVENWINKLAWTVCKRTYRRERRWKRLEKLLSLHGELTNSNQAVPASEFDAELWHAIDELGVQTRFVVTLNLFTGWSVENISQVTGAPVQEVETHLRHGVQQIAERLEENHWSADNWKEQAAGSLENRWPAPTIDDTDVSVLVQQIEKRAHRKKLLRGPSVTLGEMAVLIAVVIMVLGLALWGNQLLVGRVPPKQGLPVPSSTPEALSQAQRTGDPFLMPRKYSGAFSAVTTSNTTETPEDIYYLGPAGKGLEEIAQKLGVTVQDLKHFNRIPDKQSSYQGQWLWVPKHPLTDQALISPPVAPVTYTLSAKDPITARDLNVDLYPSQDTYHTVWLDALVTANPKTASISTRQIFRLQLWLSDNEGLLIGGPVGHDPAEMVLWRGREIYVAKPSLSLPRFQGIGTQLSASTPLLNSTIILIKQAQIWDSPNLIYIEPGSVAGRETWILKAAANSQNGPVAMIDLDKKTGFVLHYQQIHASAENRTASQDLPDEISVRKIDFDVNFPQELFNPHLPWRGGYAMNYSGEPDPSNSYP